MSAASDPIRFLLVDDLAENLMALEALLKGDGLAFDKAQSGEAALELMLVNDYALALVDVQMPGMDGFELAEIMRANDRSRHIPIIFVTAGSGDATRRFRGYEAGAVDFIQKPIEAEVLRSKARVFTDLYDQRRQIAAQRDETARLSAALQAADAQKNRFLGVLAHELRNPLMVLMSGLNMLEREHSTRDPQMVRDHMRQGLTHVSRLVDDLLDIMRIEQGKISLRRQTVSLQERLSFAVGLVRPAIEAAGHRLTVEIPEEEITLDADPERLAQIVSNLLANAVRYTPDGGDIRLTARRMDDIAVIEISDTGVGIAPDHQGRIFEIFEQGEASRGGPSDGLGIGLALVRQLAELHGGTVALVRSAPGEGSTFELRLPLK